MHFKISFFIAPSLFCLTMPNNPLLGGGGGVKVGRNQGKFGNIVQYLATEKQYLTPVGTTTEGGGGGDREYKVWEVGNSSPPPHRQEKLRMQWDEFLNTAKNKHLQKSAKSLLIIGPSS